MGRYFLNIQQLMVIGAISSLARTRVVWWCAKQVLRALILLQSLIGLFAQSIQITSPVDGAVVYSGRILTVMVTAEPFAFRSITIFTPDHEHTAVLTASPYRLSFRLPPQIPSGPNRRIVAMGIPMRDDTPVYASIDVDIERADRPHRLVPDPEFAMFRYVGEEYPLDVTGVFVDGLRIGLEKSTYTKYSSDTPSVATVDQRGMVHAVAPGRAKVTATYAPPSEISRSVSASVIVTVPQPMVVLPLRSSLYASESEEMAVTLAIQPDLDQSVTWSMNPELGSIDHAGVYTAPQSVGSPQKVTITATSVADPKTVASAEILVLPGRKKK